MTRYWFENKDKQFDCQSLVVRLLDLSKNRGANVEQVLRGTGVFYEDLFLSDHYISFEQLEALLANAQRLVSSQDLSFLLGRRLITHQQGDVSPLVYNVRTLQDLLNVVRCYQYLLFPWLYFTVKRYDDKTWLLVNSSVSESEQNDVLFEIFCTALNAICKWHIGHQVPMHFYFKQKRPKNIYQFEENLGHRLVFDYPMDMIAVDNIWLSKPLTNSNILARNFHRKQCSTALKKVPQRTGLLQLVAHKLKHNQNLSLEQVAESLHVSPATFKRKLKQHNTSYQKLQDRVRSQTALFDLKVKGLTNEQAAATLNFSSLANFRRAIKRWTGLTPSELKARVKNVIE